MLAKPRLPAIPVLADADISSAGGESHAHPVAPDGGPYRDPDPSRARIERLAGWLRALDEAETKRARVERELALLRELEPKRPAGGRGPLASRLGELAVMTLAASAFSAGLVTVTLDGVAQEPRREPAEEPREVESDDPSRSAPAPRSPAGISPRADISPTIDGTSPSSPAPAHAETGLEVERVGRFERVLSRSFVERVLSTGGEGVRSARASLYERSGVVLGVRVFGVRRGSDLDALGIENGDVLVRLNGLPMSDPSAALEAYAALRASTHFELDLLRRGRPLRLRYTVLG
jgi:hypothetical protein